MQISEAESVIMEVLWRSKEATADDIIAEIATPQNWKPATIKTLLNRLLKKGSITARKDGRRFIYTASTQRSEYITERSKGLIDRFFGGRIAPFVSQLSEQEPLTQKDIGELKKLIERLEDAG